MNIIQKNRNRKPNIVWFIADDTGDRMLGYAGGPVKTPNIDRIADEGVNCTQYHCASPACGPSRYSYLTGLYPGHCPSPRFRGDARPDRPNNIGFNADFLPGQQGLPAFLKQNGYATGFTGKWHVGIPRSRLSRHSYNSEDDPSNPEIARKLREDYELMQEQVRGTGFEYAEGIAWGNTDNRPIRKLQYHNLEWHTDSALRFLDKHAGGDKPFFLNMATTTMHGPHHVRSLETAGLETEFGFLDEAPNVQPSRKSVFDRLEKAGMPIDHHTAGTLWMDDAFGAVMNKVEDMGLADNTIFIWSTDHGMGTISSKFTCYQGGVRIPHCMKWDGHIPPGSVCDALLENIDFSPTLLEMAGIELPEEARIDGQSYWPVISGGKEEIHEDLYFEWGITRAVRTRKWKYLAFRHTPEQIAAMKNGEVDTALQMSGKAGGNFTMHMHPHYFEPDQLYDLENDPEEKKNLADDPKYADVLKDMKSRLQGYTEEFSEPFDVDKVDPFVKSGKYRELIENSRADKRIYEYYYYKEKAY